MMTNIVDGIRKRTSASMVDGQSTEPFDGRSKGNAEFARILRPASKPGPARRLFRRWSVVNVWDG